jgi:sugar/nucleoside kinase (ribokinase family)
MLALLGARVTIISHWGAEQNKILKDLSLQDGVTLRNILTPAIDTPRKTRFIHTDNKQRVFELVSIDPRISFSKIDVDCSAVRELYDLMLVYDFGHGFIGDTLRDELHKNTTVKWVNAQTNSENYGYNLITKYEGFNNFILDRREASLAVGIRSIDDRELFNLIQRKLAPENLCMTLGSQGCMFARGESSPEVFPALSSSPRDATGAGDAFFLMYALTMRITQDAFASAALASIFAAQKVAVTGHNAPLTIRNFKKNLESILRDK